MRFNEKKKKHEVSWPIFKAKLICTFKVTWKTLLLNIGEKYQIQ